MKTKLILLLLVFSSCKGTKISSLKECETATIPENLAQDTDVWFAEFSRQKLADEHICFKLIEHVNVVDVENGKILLNQNVLLYDDSIVEISQGKKLRFSHIKPNCVKKIDGTAKYLAPGLCDMHSHYCGQVRLDYILHGITTVRVANTERDQIIEQLLVNTGQLLGPEVFCTSPQFYNLQMLDSLKRQMSDNENVFNWLYLNSATAPGMFTSYIKHAAENNISVSVDMRSELPGACKYSNGTVFEQPHSIIGFSDNVNLSTYWFISKMAFEKILSDKHVLVSDEIGTTWAASKQIMDAFITYLKAHPAQYCIGTEGGSRIRYNELMYPGEMFLKEIKLLQEYGIPNIDIIRMSTVNANSLLQEAIKRQQDQDSTLIPDLPIGAVKPGYKANLVLLNANPLENAINYSKIAAIFIKGHYLNESDIQLLKKKNWKNSYDEN